MDLGGASLWIWSRCGLQDFELLFFGFCFVFFLTCALQQNLSIAHSPNKGFVILSSCYCHAVCGRIQTHTKNRTWTSNKTRIRLFQFKKTFTVLVGSVIQDGLLIPLCLEKVRSLSSCSSSASISSSVSHPSSSPAFPGSSKSTSPKSSAKSSDRRHEASKQKCHDEPSQFTFQENIRVAPGRRTTLRKVTRMLFDTY